MYLRQPVHVINRYLKWMSEDAEADEAAKADAGKPQTEYGGFDEAELERYREMAQ